MPESQKTYQFPRSLRGCEGGISGGDCLVVISVRSRCAVATAIAQRCKVLVAPCCGCAANGMHAVAVPRLPAAGGMHDEPFFS
jgi:hypothetical protein